MCIQLYLDIILDKDKYKLSPEFDAILGGLVNFVHAQYLSISLINLSFP